VACQHPEHLVNRTPAVFVLNAAEAEPGSCVGGASGQGLMVEFLTTRLGLQTGQARLGARREAPEALLATVIPISAESGLRCGEEGLA
jgi:hypothetical protein